MAIAKSVRERNLRERFLHRRRTSVEANDRKGYCGGGGGGVRNEIDAAVNVAKRDIGRLIHRRIDGQKYTRAKRY